MALAGNTPRYNEWFVARRIDVATFAPDADWIATQDDLLPDGNGEPTQAFQIPPLPGRPAKGFAVMLVGVDAGGASLPPGGGSVDIDFIEIVQYSGQYNDDAPHIAAVESLTTPLTPLTYSVPAYLSVRIPNVGGAQNQFALRLTALTPPAGAVEVRLLVKALG